MFLSQSCEVGKSKPYQQCSRIVRWFFSMCFSPPSTSPVLVPGVPHVVLGEALDIGCVNCLSLVISKMWEILDHSFRF